MKAWLIKYLGEQVESNEIIDLPDDYDGDPYGNTVPFVMASNWELRVVDDTSPETSVELQEDHEDHEEPGHTALSFDLDDGWKVKVLSFPEESTTRLLYNHHTYSHVTQLNISVTASYSRGILAGLHLAFYMKQKLAEPREAIGHARPLEWESFNLIYDYRQEGDCWSATPDLGRFNGVNGAYLACLGDADVTGMYSWLAPECGRILIQFPGGSPEALKIRTSIRTKPPGGVL